MTIHFNHELDMPFDPVSNTVNALISAVEAIEIELGIVPAGAYANVRARLDILEARINNPLAPAPNVPNPFFIDNTGVTIQAGVGDPNLVLVVPPAPGSIFLREDSGPNLGLYSFRPDGYWHLLETNFYRVVIQPNITVSYAVGLLDDFIPCDSLSNPITITLLSNPPLGKIFTVADVTGHANTNNITINGNGLLINGASSLVINSQYGSTTFTFNGTGYTAK